MRKLIFKNFRDNAIKAFKIHFEIIGGAMFVGFGFTLGAVWALKLFGYLGA